MMMSPESFYEKSIKCKTLKQLQGLRYRMRREIKELESIVSDEILIEHGFCSPSPATRLYWKYEYLKLLERRINQIKGKD